MLQYEHENDTEDIPENLEPLSYVSRGSAMEFMKLQEMQKNFWKLVPDEETGESSLVQYDHDNDTEDIPEGQDPIAYRKVRGKYEAEI